PGRRGEGLPEERGRRGVHGEQRIAAAALRLAAFGHGQAEALRDGADRLGERERLRLHDETEDVAVLATPEAVVEAALLAHRERRGLLRVERAEAHHGPA